MQYQTHKELHETIGTYVSAGGDLSDYVVNSTTAANRRPLISQTTVMDEDNGTVMPALSSETYTRFYLTSIDSAKFTTSSADIVSLSTNQPYWNQLNGGNWQQTLMANNSYSAAWVVGIPVASDAQSQPYRYLFVQPQSNSSTLSTIQAQSASSVSLGKLTSLTPELVFFAKIIIQYTANNWKIVSVEKLIGNKINQQAIIGGSYLSTVTTDTTLTGNGTTSNPLKVDTTEIATAHQLSLRVPFSGADRDVDLGANSVNAKKITITSIPIAINQSAESARFGTGNDLFDFTIKNNITDIGNGDIFLKGANSFNSRLTIGTGSPGGTLRLQVNDSSIVSLLNNRVGINNINPQYSLDNFGITNSIDYYLNNTPLLLNTFKQGNLGGAGNIFYSTGASSQPASGSVTDVVGDNYIKNQNTSPQNANIHISGEIKAITLNSYTPTGTPPLTVVSTTKVDSLNAGLLDGKKASDFQLKSDTLTFDATLSDLADSTAAIRALANTKATISGTDNYIMKKTGANTLGNSFLFQDASFLKTNADLKFEKAAPAFYFKDSHSNYSGFFYVYDSIFGIQKRDYSTDAYISNPYGFSLAAPHNTISVNNFGNFAFGHNVPLAKIHPISTTTQLRLGYDATKYTDLSTGSTGNLTIDPTGDTTKVVGAVNSTGGFFKNGVEIGSGGINYIGMTMPTGLSVSPANLTANGTFTISYPSGYTYFTDSERSIYSNANQKRITSASFSGTTTKTLTLSQVDGNVLQASFTDLQGTSQWTNDANGMYYNSGNVTVGTGASTTAAKFYVYNNVATYSIYGNHGGSGYGVLGLSQSGAGVYGTSSTGFGGFFEGLGCKATKFYVSSLNTAPASSSATGTTGEIRFTSDYIYVCVATNTWKRTQISTW